MTLYSNDAGTKLLWADYAKTKLAGGPACCVVRCLDGQDIEITIQGISDGICGNCELVNDTYIKTLSSASMGTCCVGYICNGTICSSLTGSETCPAQRFEMYFGKRSGYAWHVLIRLVLDSTFGLTRNVTLDWRATNSDALDIIHRLCAGEPAEVPFYGTFQSAGENMVCVDPIRVLGEYDVYGTGTCLSDGSPILLAAA